MLAKGVDDLAIIGEDYAENSGFNANFVPIGDAFILSRVTKSKTRISLIGKEDEEITAESLRGKVIATEVLNLAEKTLSEKYGFSADDFVRVELSEKNKEEKIKTAREKGKVILYASDGGTEAKIVEDYFLEFDSDGEVFEKNSAVADYAIETVETGNSLRQNNLKLLEVLFESGPRLFLDYSKLNSVPGERKREILKTGMKIWLEIQRVLLPKIENRRLYKMNLPKENLEKATKLFPGKNPTIAEEMNFNGGEKMVSFEILLTAKEIAVTRWKLPALGADEIIASEKVGERIFQKMFDGLNPELFPQKLIQEFLSEI